MPQVLPHPKHHVRSVVGVSLTARSWDITSFRGEKKEINIEVVTDKVFRLFLVVHSALGEGSGGGGAKGGVFTKHRISVSSVA